MFGSPILDVVIGLILVFLLLSLICSAIREGIAGMSGVRAKLLARGIDELLQKDRQLISDFYMHPQIWSLYRGSYTEASKKKWFFKNGMPSYIPSRNFALALMDMAARGRNSQSALQASAEASVLSADTIRRNVGNIGNPFVQRLILSAVDTAGSDLEKARKEIETWFNASMERVSGWYKRRTQAVLFGIGVVVTVALDVNAVTIGKQLYLDPGKRQAAVAMATAIARDTANRTAAASSALANDAYQKLESLGLPDAWSIKSDQGVVRYVLNSAIGWLLTAFAISFGAPFWFDTLSKIMTIRSTAKPGEKAAADGEAKAGQATTVTVNAPATAPSPSVQPMSQPPRFAAAGNGQDSFQPHEWTSGRRDGGIL